MTSFNGVWQVVSTNSADDFIKIAFKPGEDKLAELFKELIEDLSFEEHMFSNGRDIHRKCYLRGELFDEVHSEFDMKVKRKDMFGDFSVVVTRIADNIVVKTEEYVGRPKIVISVTVDEDYMIAHKTVICEEGSATVTRRLRRVSKKNTAKEDEMITNGN